MVRLSLSLLLSLLATSSVSVSAQHAHPGRAAHRRLAHPDVPAAGPAPGLAFRDLTLDARAGAPELNDSLTSSSVSTESITVSTPAETPTSSAASSSVVVTTSSLVTTSSTSATTSSVVTSSVTSSTAAATTVTSTSTSTPSTTSTSSTTAAATVPTTVSITSTSSSTTPPTLVGQVTTGKATGTVASHSAGSTYSAAAASERTSTSGLSKTGLIAIIVVSILVALALAWTLFRKLVLAPRRRRERHARRARGRNARGAAGVDFSPTGGLPDPFFEKTRRRPSQDSISSADRQRRQFVSELENDEHGAAPGYPPLVDGIPAHDFTAGPASSYAPYGGPEAHEMQYAPNGGYATDPALGQGYADLHRGPSDGAAYAPHGDYHDAYAPHQDYGAPMPMDQGMHAQGLPYAAYGGGADGGYPQHHAQDMYEHQQPDSLGRPTQGEGPYMIASQAGYGGR